MSTFLFGEIIFGPVASRRLGVSLGINLLPKDRKLCSFNCIYCECGLNPGKDAPSPKLPTRKQVATQLERKLQEMQKDGKLPDVLTFAGNGEPTLHPDFAAIIDDTIELRERYCPQARIAVLSNATRLHRPAVFDALLKVDDNIQKLDSALEQTVQLLDQPQGRFSLTDTVAQLQKFKGRVTIQTLFVKGHYQGQSINNTTEEEVQAWLQLLQEIAPREVMIYTIARDTPIPTLEKADSTTLHAIANRVRALGIKAQVST